MAREKPSGRFTVSRAPRESMDHHPGWSVLDRLSHQYIGNLSLRDLADLLATIEEVITDGA